MLTGNTGAALDVKIGAHAECSDGSAGRVTKLVVEPGSKRVTDLVVEHGLLLHHAVVVPVGDVVGAEGDTVLLTLSLVQLKALPEYAEIDFAIPDADWAERHGYPRHDTLVGLSSYPWGGMDLAPASSGSMIVTHVDVGVSETETPIGRGTRVSCRDGVVGVIDHVLIDPETETVRTLVVAKGHLLTKDVVVPAAWVEEVREDETVLATDRAMLEKLPEYRPGRSNAAIAANGAAAC